MPTDAKLGMVVGVALVITIGIVYYRREMQPAQAAAIPTKGTAVVGQVGLKRPDNGEAISGKLMSNKATEEPGKE